MAKLIKAVYQYDPLSKIIKSFLAVVCLFVLEKVPLYVHIYLSFI